MCYSSRIKITSAVLPLQIGELHRADTEVDLDQAGCEHDAKIAARMPSERGAESTMTHERTYSACLKILGGSIILLNKDHIGPIIAEPLLSFQHNTPHIPGHLIACILAPAPTNRHPRIFSVARNIRH